MEKSFSFIEISHPIKEGMTTYPGLPEPQAEIFLDYDESQSKYKSESEFKIASLHLCGNTGTYVDSPHHRYRDGRDLANLPLTSLAHLPVLVLDLTKHKQRAIDIECFKNLDLCNKAVLINTGWSQHWETDQYFEKHPFLTAAACDFLVQEGVKFVGIDSLNTEDFARPAHTKLLSAGIPVCEHMTNLAAVPSKGTFLHAVPIAWVGGTTFPVRAYVMQPE